jgi:hypothetical protein
MLVVKVIILILILFSFIIADGFEDYTNLGKIVHYVRQGATGTGDGSNWDNAFTNLPQILVRDHVYFVADGIYDWPNLDDAESGTNMIYIVKATEDDHGLSPGWNSMYGDGMAETSGFQINSGYYIIDGQVRMSGTSGYGFKVSTSGNCSGSAEKLIDFNAGHHVTLAYIDVQHCGYSYTGGQDCVLLDGDSDNVTISHCWMHDVNRVHIYSFYCINLTIEYCWFTERFNRDTYGVHGESFTVYGNQANMNHIYRYNVFRNVEGTGIIVIQNQGSGGYEIYGNLFYNDADYILDGQTSADPNPVISDFDCTNGSIADTGPYVNYDVQIYNNTHVDLFGATGYGVNNTGYTDIIVRNGLFVNCQRVSVAANTESDNITNGSVLLFRDYENKDFTLSGPLPGYSLDSPHNEDMHGNIRGQDGVFDIGAFEYNEGYTIPAKPRGVLIEAED